MNIALTKLLGMLEPAALKALHEQADKLPTAMASIVHVLVNAGDDAVRANNPKVFDALQMTTDDQIHALQNQVSAIVTALNLATNHSYVTALATPQLD